MPDAKDNAKMTGDTHPPEIEPELPFEEGSSHEPGMPGNRGQASESGKAGGPGRGIKHAGLLKDNDSKTREESAPRESGQASGPSGR